MKSVQQVLAHPVEGDLVDEAVVADEADDRRRGPLSRSTAQRKNFTYMSDRAFLLVAFESLA